MEYTLTPTEDLVCVNLGLAGKRKISVFVRMDTYFNKSLFFSLYKHLTVDLIYITFMKGLFILQYLSCISKCCLLQLILTKSEIHEEA